MWDILIIGLWLRISFLKNGYKNQNYKIMINQQTKRIEYLDAMRGFTMFLVVLTHVPGFVLGLDPLLYEKLFTPFRMPLFFFVSGFVFFKKDFVWNGRNSLQFLKRKLSVQIVSPLLFLLIFVIYSNQKLNDVLLNDYQKSGYWFTFTLFEYFIFYILFRNVFDFVFRHGEVLEDVFMFLASFAIYIFTVWSLVTKYSLDSGIGALIGVPNWHFFVFFTLGTLTRKYFSQFERLLDLDGFLTSCIVMYAICIIFPKLSSISNTLYLFLMSTIGIVIVFAIFRKNRLFFSRNSRIGKIAQFVGRRTLDIYLLHYFFLFSNTQVILLNSSIFRSPLIAFFLSSLIAIIVVIFSLAMSGVLRQSTFLAHYLFGQKIIPQK